MCVNTASARESQRHTNCRNSEHRGKTGSDNTSSRKKLEFEAECHSTRRLVFSGQEHYDESRALVGQDSRLIMMLLSRGNQVAFASSLSLLSFLSTCPRGASKPSMMGSCNQFHSIQLAGQNATSKCGQVRASDAEMRGGLVKADENGHGSATNHEIKAAVHPPALEARSNSDSGLP